MKPRLLDLYSCAGGASLGYQAAGFEVFGSDISPQPRYPFAFHQGDALEVLDRLLAGGRIRFQRADSAPAELALADFDAIHTSPPCQLYSLTHRINRSDFPDLIGPTRDRLERTGLPWIIENVAAALPELRNPVLLCGTMLGRPLYRHRLFETSFPLEQPPHLPHVVRQTKMGRPPAPDEYMHVVGNFSGVARARRDMEIPHATRNELSEAIPPAYSQHVGQALLAVIAPRRSPR